MGTRRNPFRPARAVLAREDGGSNTDLSAASQERTGANAEQGIRLNFLSHPGRPVSRRGRYGLRRIALRVATKGTRHAYE
jgi:hypothetical protein